MPLTKKMTTKSLEPPFCLVLPRLNLFVHNNRNRRQGNQFCKPHLLAVELGPWAVGSEHVEHYEVWNLHCCGVTFVRFSQRCLWQEMTTKSLGAKDVLTPKEGWLLSETSREALPYDLQVLINHKEYFPLSGSFCFCRWYLSSPVTECIHSWSFVLDWVMGVVVEASLFFCDVFL